MQYKWVALTVTTVGALMWGIDTRIVIVGLPTVARQLHAGPAEVVWITQAYVLASCVGLLFIGRVTDLFGRVKVYNIGFAIFTIGSALCSLSFNIYELIGFRLVQGVGAGILGSLSAAILTDSSPPNERAFMLGMNQTSARFGAMAGLTLSGVILSVTDWRGLFYINVPIGIFGTIWAHRRLREIAKTDTSRKMDWSGVLLFSSGLSLILISITNLSYGTSGYIFGSGLLLLGTILIVLFIRTEMRVKFPLLDFKLFKITLFAAGNLAQVLNVLAWSGMLLLVPFFLQIGLGYSALKAGVGMIPLEGTFLVSTLVGGKLADKYGTRILCTVGLVITTLSFYYVSTFGASTSYFDVALALSGTGVGNGFFLPPNLSAIMGSVPPDRRGIGSAFRQTMNNVGWTVSFGLVILFMTIGISYSSLSQLLQQPHLLILSSARLEFLNGFRATALILTLICASAIVPSIMRGKSRQYVEEERSV